MPDFTLIDGDYDPKHWDRLKAQRQFEEFATSLVRTLAGRGSEYTVATNLHALVDQLLEADLPTVPVVTSAIASLRSRAFARDRSGFLDQQIDHVVEAALLVAAEGMAIDSLARARKSKQVDRLERQIEQQVIESERRARESGWSYVARLTQQHLGSWPPPRSSEKLSKKPGAKGKAPKSGSDIII